MHSSAVAVWNGIWEWRRGLRVSNRFDGLVGRWYKPQQQIGNVKYAMSTRIIVQQLGVVVIGRNEGQRLIDCLVSLRHDADSIVYVDSGSTDGSPEAAGRLGILVVRLDSAQPFSAARARNEGFSALKALRPQIRFVQFVDGDCELARGWLEAALAFMSQRPDVALVCGRRRERYPERSIYNRLCDIEWDTPVGEASSCGGDSLVRVEAFEAVGGFRPQLIAGEEPELCIRLRQRGCKIWRLDVEMTRHDVAMTRFSEWWTRAIRSGYGAAEVSRLHRQSEFDVFWKQAHRAVFWGGMVPLLIGLGTLIHPIALCGVALYPMQVYRTAISRGRGKQWTYGFFLTLAKFAELHGVLKYYLRQWNGRTPELIEYKRAHRQGAGNL
jgi:GT2 family glycosyltransferase